MRWNLYTISPKSFEKHILQRIKVIFLEIRDHDPSSGSDSGYDVRKLAVHILDKEDAEGAEGVILGCTEIPLLIRQEDTFVPLFDTTMIHARYAVEYASDIRLGK